MSLLSLHQLKPSVPRKPRRRRGRGNAAGQGTYAGRGLKGQKARAGSGRPAGFEGGRSSLIIQTPKMRGKGFRSLKPEMQVVDLSRLNVFTDGEKITLKALRSKGIIDFGPAKVLSTGKLTKKLQVAVPVSASARAAIEAAGGSVVAEEKTN